MSGMSKYLYVLSDFVDERTHPRNYQIFLLLLYALLIAGGILASASPDRVAVGGVPIPPLCPFKLVTGHNCPGCGITRALVLAFHGEWRASFAMHLWGIPLALLALLQVPYRLYRIFGGRPAHLSAPVKTWTGRLVLLSLLLPWAAKLAHSLL